MNLDFKLKLLQRQENHHLWNVTFLFDDFNESESKQFVDILYNAETKTFTCLCYNIL